MPEIIETSDKSDRRTPRWFFEQCVARYGPFQLDAAANAENALCVVWIGPGSTWVDSETKQAAIDGLSCAWGPQNASCITVWCNPPYGPNGTIPKWIAKARRESLRGIRTLMLLPADTSTAWYQDVVRTELCELVPFRLSFEAPDGSTKGNSAKFGSVLVWIAPKIRNIARTRVRRANRRTTT